MKKLHPLIWAAWLTHAVAWFLPVIGEGTTLPQGLPGWQAFRVAFCAVWPYRDAQFEHWYNTVLCTISAVTTPLFIFGSVWLVWFGSRRVRLVSAWIAVAAFVINAQWYLFVSFGPTPNDLKIGYFLWWLSFLLLAWGLFAMSSSKPQDGSQ
ncbi:MAG TPA: hypothetical protein VMH20_17290 [Verrucomicrobiae bacterium]|nr:hypothetical protein [Verrucomicrobiae bacterium]